jgi:hypothetical protein
MQNLHEKDEENCKTLSRIVGNFSNVGNGHLPNINPEQCFSHLQYCRLVHMLKKALCISTQYLVNELRITISQTLDILKQNGNIISKILMQHVFCFNKTLVLLVLHTQNGAKVS